MNIRHIIDLSHATAAAMPTYPGDDPVFLEQVRMLPAHTYTDHRLTTGMHVGTHIDGPAHLFAGAPALDQFPASHFIRPGILIDARNKGIDAPLLEQVSMQPDAIVLVLTGHDKKFGSNEYFIDHPTLTAAFAHALISRKINILGIDLPSPDRPPFQVHRMLLQRNILIMENLTGLERLVGIDHFTVAALPLKIKADSAPARVVAFY
jgi:kynurenine formamidase